VSRPSPEDGGDKEERRRVFRLGAALLLGDSYRRAIRSGFWRGCRIGPSPDPRIRHPAPVGLAHRLSPARSARQQRPASGPSLVHSEQAQLRGLFRGAGSPRGSPARLSGVPSIAAALHDPTIAIRSRSRQRFSQEKFFTNVSACDSKLLVFVWYGINSVIIAFDFGHVRCSWSASACDNSG
jgi:hypothetical protein